MLYYLNALFAIICCHNCGECVQNVNILDEAVQQLNSNHCLQPVLFRFNDMLWIKTDNSAVAVPNVSCIADAFDYLFRFFWVVNVEYPNELRLVFGFFENLLRLKPTIGKSVAITEFMRAVLPSPWVKFVVSAFIYFYIVFPFMFHIVVFLHPSH